MVKDGWSGAAALSATFRAFVAVELGRETAVDKEKRNAQEAQDVRGKAKSSAKASHEAEREPTESRLNNFVGLQNHATRVGPD